MIDPSKHTQEPSPTQKKQFDFQADLAEGQKVEKEFVRFLELQGLKAFLNDGVGLEAKRRFDVGDSLGRTFEIKYDRQWEQTGNVFLEHKALIRSSADYIVYKLDRFYQIPRLALVELLRHNHQIPKWKEVAGGQFNDIGTLMPVSEFQKTFTPI